MPIKVIVADDHPLFRKGIVSSIRKHKDIEIAFEAKNGKEVVEYLQSDSTADTLLLDLNMPLMSGMDVLDEIKRMSHPVKTIIISMGKEEEIIQKAVEAGACGYVSKEDDDSELYTAIDSVMRNGFYFSEMTNKAMLSYMLHRKQKPDPFTEVHLSQRELKVIKYLSLEMTNEEIAKEMYCSIRTIEGIRQELIHKVGVRNAIGLILYAQKNNLLSQQ